MGAALTYARRYALFTLVGIAGEDDLDAPETGPADGVQGAQPIPVVRASKGGGTIHKATSRNGKPPPRRCSLPPAESAAARTKLIGELDQLASAEMFTGWAYRHMAAKNSLTIDDALLVEQAFQTRLERATQSPPAAEAIIQNTPVPSGHTPLVATPAEAPPTSNFDGGNPAQAAGAIDSPRPNGRIDKSVLAIGEPRRYRDKAHLKFVAAQACLVCGRQPSDPHHLRFAQAGALGRKVSDEFTVPLCRVHHREVHRSSNEAHWWKAYRLDPLAVASALWAQTRRPAVQLTAPALRTGSPNESATGESALSNTRKNSKTNPIAGIVRQ
jgi:hypothetical protein